MQITSKELSAYYLGSKVFPDSVIRNQIDHHKMLNDSYAAQGDKVYPLDHKTWAAQLFCTLEASMFSAFQKDNQDWQQYIGKFDEQLDKVANIVFARYLELLLIPTHLELEVHYLFGQRTNDSPEEFIFAHTDLSRVKDEQEDESTTHCYPFSTIIRTSKVSFQVHP